LQSKKKGTRCCGNFSRQQLCSTPAEAAADVKTSHEARTLKITVLVTNVAGDPHLGDGEWGYSALVEVDGHNILYDTGASVWTGAKLKSYRIENLLAGHCTGIEATYRLRESTGLSRKTAVVSAAGSSFALGFGIDARMLAH
jgi:hypothetical protein